MSELRVKPRQDRGLVTEVTPASAGWGYVGFALHRLEPGQSLAAETDKREVCLVWVSGRARLAIDGKDFGEIGERMSPFEGPPWAAYIPAGGRYTVTAVTPLELAVCSAPGKGAHPAKLIPPGAHPQIVRGKGSNTRHVTNIMPEDDGSADALLVVEVITPGGNTSSYPPHKHDRDALPDESYLEETYYHRFNPPQGFGFQRVYTDDRTLDEVGADRRRRRGDGAEGLSSGRHPARLRQLLSERDGWAEADLEVPQRTTARVAVHRGRRAGKGELRLLFRDLVMRFPLRGLLRARAYNFARTAPQCLTRLPTGIVGLGRLGRRHRIGRRPIGHWAGRFLQPIRRGLPS